MAQNISKYVQLNDFILLEYEFGRDDKSYINISDSSVGGAVGITQWGTKQYYNSKQLSLGITNNKIRLNSTPLDIKRSNWVNNYENSENNTATQWFPNEIDSNVGNNTGEYLHDTIKLHIISGYNFDDTGGFLLQIRAEDASSNMVDLSNFTYIKQPESLGSSDVVRFSSNTFHLGNKFYDKYVEFKVPSIQALGSNISGSLGSGILDVLNIKDLSDVFISYSSISSYTTDNNDNNNYVLLEESNLQLPVESLAESFNAFIAESTVGDFIEFYGTWDTHIIGEYMGDIESGRIPLYTSNNPNDNYEEFENTYGQASKWVLIHEIYVKEQIGSGEILSQKYVFTQDDNFNIPNYFRPVLRNADIDSSYTIEYICRLNNRMDGTQIIRKASFGSTNPKKYGLKFQRINVENIIPYKIFNKIEAEKANIVENNLKPQTKYVKVFYDTTNILFNEKNEIYPQGTGPLYLKNGDSIYKFNFEKFNEKSDQKENVDLSGTYSYLLSFTLDDNSKIEVPPLYTSNMNAAIGNIDFKLSGDQIIKLLKQTNNSFSIKVKNPDKSEYTFYEGKYYKFGNN